MIFDQVRDLPTATLRPAPRSALHRLARDLRGWCARHYAWLRPRRVPVLVAFLGMLGTMQAVDYLANPPAPPLRRAELEAPGRLMFVDGQIVRDGRPIGDLPTTHRRVRVVVGP